VNRPDQCLERVGENRLSTETTAFQLARTKAQIFAQVKTTGQQRQSLALHQPRPQAGQLAFASLGETLEQRLASHEVENGITEKLQTLIVATGKNAMGQGQDHQFLILEGVAELTLKAAQGYAHGLPTLNCLSNFNTRSMFWNHGSRCS